MTSSAWPDHLLDLDEWDALPEDASRRSVYGVVDPEHPVTFSEFRLLPDTPPRYEHVADHTGYATLLLGGPITVALDPSS